MTEIYLQFWCLHYLSLPVVTARSAAALACSRAKAAARWAAPSALPVHGILSRFKSAHGAWIDTCAAVPWRPRRESTPALFRKICALRCAVAGATEREPTQHACASSSRESARRKACDMGGIQLSEQAQSNGNLKHARLRFTYRISARMSDYLLNID